MPSISIDTILKIIQEAEKIDYAHAMQALASRDPLEILGVVEQVTGILADLGVPYANDAKLAEVILGLIIRGYQDGIIQSGRPEDPAMQKAAGNTGEGTPTMQGGVVIVPGGTPDDPYAFDKR